MKVVEFEKIIKKYIIPKRIELLFSKIKLDYLINNDFRYSIITLLFYNGNVRLYEFTVVYFSAAIKYKNGFNCSLESFSDIFPEFMKYNSEEERIKLLTYILRMLYLCTETNYLNNLPKAYTFLLCNKKSNTFCRDITKIIAQKILFFKN